MLNYNVREFELLSMAYGAATFSEAKNPKFLCSERFQKKSSERKQLMLIVLSFVTVTKILITVHITWYWLELDCWG